MIVDLGKAVRGALRQEQRFGVIANHLANAATTGYKAENISFDKLFRARMRVDMAQGNLMPTGNPLDLAISGEGFFKIQTPDGDRYTRNGTFLLDPDQNLVTHDGHRVLGEDGPITLDGENITVTETGDILVDGTLSGTLKIVSFRNPEKLEKDANGFLVHKGGVAAETSPHLVSVKQHALEQSNVSTVVEMTRMVAATRQYESFQKVIQTYDEIDSKAASEVGAVK